MYEELIKQMRSVYQEIDCPDCPLAKDCMKLQGVCAFTRAADAIEELTDTNVGKWIPVTERLPEKPEGYPKCEIRKTYYLVALKSGCVKTLGYEFDRDEWQITGSPVVAWMPLPQPPKEEP